MHVRLPVVHFHFEECDLLNGQLQPDTLTPSLSRNKKQKPQPLSSTYSHVSSIYQIQSKCVVLTFSVPKLLKLYSVKLLTTEFENCHCLSGKYSKCFQTENMS